VSLIGGLTLAGLLGGLTYYAVHVADRIASWFKPERGQQR
jgi:hypothetical protein